MFIKFDLKNEFLLIITILLISIYSFRENIININEIIFNFILLTKLIIIKILVDVIILRFFVLIKIFFRNNFKFEIVNNKNIFFFVVINYILLTIKTLLIIIEEFNIV